MIIVKNRKMLIPAGERLIGTDYDSNSEQRVFRIDRYTQTETDLSGLSGEARAVYDLLDRDPVPLDVLFRRTGLQPGTLASALYELQTKGLADECGRNHFIRR